MSEGEKPPSDWQPPKPPGPPPPTWQPPAPPQPPPPPEAPGVRHRLPAAGPAHAAAAGLSAATVVSAAAGPAGHLGGQPLAGWWYRVGAALLDGLIVGIPAIAVVLAIDPALGVLIWLTATLTYFPLLMMRQGASERPDTRQADRRDPRRPGVGRSLHVRPGRAA